MASKQGLVLGKAVALLILPSSCSSRSVMVGGTDRKSIKSVLSRCSAAPTDVNELLTGYRPTFFTLHHVALGARNSDGELLPATAHLVLNFRDLAPPSPRGVLANATPRRFPLRLITRNLSSGI